MEILHPKNMKLTLQLFGILAFTSLFLSCEGSTTRERRITNNSSTSIHVVADGANLSNYNKSITPSMNEGFFTSQQRVGTQTLEDPASGVNNIEIVNTFGDTCTKDFFLIDNWDIKTERKSEIPSEWKHEYTFIVEDSDF